MKFKDLKGWKLKRIDNGLYNKSKYAVYVSPDGDKIAQVHMDDNEVSVIYNRKTMKIEYMHPKTALGEKRLGVSLERLMSIMYR